MDKIQWCISKGLSLVDPNTNLAHAYMTKAEEALQSMRVNVIRNWKISTAYYTIYFSLYAILMKIGVKCEVHACTIAFAQRFLKEHIHDIKFLKDCLQARIDSQYYIDRTVAESQYERMLQIAPEFMIMCKSILTRLPEHKIKAIRREIDVLEKKKEKERKNYN